MFGEEVKYRGRGGDEGGQYLYLTPRRQKYEKYWIDVRVGERYTGRLPGLGSLHGVHGINSVIMLW